MNRNIFLWSYSWMLNGALLLAVAFILFLRFVNLDADFPLRITWSAVLYTDEGWYANAAVRYYLSGAWYLAGDFNPAINMPIGQLVHSLTFSILGIGLASARMTTAVFFVFLVVLTALLVKRRWGSSAAILAALLLATNYTGFAFSRLAIMENIALFFIIFGLLVAEKKNAKRRLARLMFASILFAAAILTKFTMIFGAPLLVYIIWFQGKNHKERITLLAASALIILFMVGGYHLTAKMLFPEDYIYFGQINFEARMHRGITDWLLNIPTVIDRIKVLGISFLGVTVFITTCALVISKPYRKDPLVHIWIIYIVMYLALLSMTPYGPPRYYIPLIVPFSGLCAAGAVALKRRLCEYPRFDSAILSGVPVILIFVIALNGSGKIMTYLSHPNFSFRQMAHEVREIIQEREGQLSDILLFGNIADSVALEIGARSVNTRLGTDSLIRKIRKYRPRYLLLHIDEEVQETVKADGGYITKLSSWNVYGNYYGNGQQVQLMHVCWDGEDDIESDIVIPLQ